MELSYVAHSERCALLLDSAGVCRWIVPKADADDELVASARSCIGAQFVACVDRSIPGLMSNEPRVGTSLLFAVVTQGRVSLVRFGPLQSFEKLTTQAQRSDDTDLDVSSSLSPRAPHLELALEDEMEDEIELEIEIENAIEDDGQDDDDEPTVHRPSGVQIRAHVAVMDPFDDDVTAPGSRAARDIAVLEQIAATYARRAS